MIDVKAMFLLVKEVVPHTERRGYTLLSIIPSNSGRCPESMTFHGTCFVCDTEAVLRKGNATRWWLQSSCKKVLNYPLAGHRLHGYAGELCCDITTTMIVEDPGGEI